MSELAMWLGYAVMGLGVVGTVVGLLVLLCYLCNVAAHYIVDSYGGVETLNEFIRWHKNQKSAAAQEPPHDRPR